MVSVDNNNNINDNNNRPPGVHLGVYEGLEDTIDELQGELNVALAERDQADYKNHEMEIEIRDLEDELKVEREENELFQEYLNVADADEANRKFIYMKNKIENLEKRNDILEERLRIVTGDR